MSTTKRITRSASKSANEIAVTTQTFTSKRQSKPTVRFSPDTDVTEKPKPAKNTTKNLRKKAYKQSVDPDTELASPKAILLSPGQLSKETCPCALTLLSVTDWIECSHCKQWWHSQCTGNPEFAQSQYKHKSEIPFVCNTVCLSKSVTSQAVRDLVLLNLCSSTKPAFPDSSTVSNSPEQITIFSTSSTALDSSIQTNEFATGNSQIPSSEENSSLSENIVILDGINNTTYTDSRDILNEVKDKRPELGITLAYVLPAGGIALHCRSVEDKNLALSPWPEKSFNSDHLSTHLPASATPIKKTVIVRNITKDITDKDIALAVNQATGDTVTVRRFKNRRTGRFMPIAQITASDSNTLNSDKLLTEGLQIRNRTLPCEPRRTAKVIRCFNCQAYGHTSSYCKNKKTCVDCAEYLSDTNNHRCNTKHCINCQGTHAADSKLCPKYKEKLQYLTTKARENRRTYKTTFREDEDSAAQYQVPTHLKATNTTLRGKKQHQDCCADRDMEQRGQANLQKLEHQESL